MRNRNTPKRITGKSIESERAALMQFALSWGRQGVPNSNEALTAGVYQWGQRNNYHEFLYKLYNESAIHKGIVDGKTHYLVGGGVEGEDVDDLKFKDFQSNGSSRLDLDDVLRRVALDYELLNQFFVIVKLSFDRTRVTLEYRDAGKIRLSQDGKYLYKKDWSSTSSKAEVWQPYSEDLLTFAYWHREDSKSADDAKDLGIYPKPSYMGGVKDIISSIQISNFRMLEVMNGFKGGTMIVVQKPSDPEEEAVLIQQIKDGAANTDGKGFITVVFTDNGENPVEVMTINGSDLDRRYVTTEESILQNIFIAHNVTSPALFGIKTQGQLGQSQELEIAYTIFQNTYIAGRQKVLSSFLQWVWGKILGNSGTVYVAPNRSLFELGDTIGDKLAALPAIAQAAIIQKLTADELRDMVGLPPVAPELLPQPEEVQNLSDVDIFTAYGRPRSMFKVLDSQSIPHNFDDAAVTEMASQTRAKYQFSNAGKFSLKGLAKRIRSMFASMTKAEAAILDILNAGTRDVNEIADKSGLKPEEVERTIARLTERGMIETDLTPRVDAPSIDFEIVYSYEERPDAPPLKEGGKSRPFCTGLLTANLFYTREEIDQISAALAAQGVTRGFDNYPDVWRYRGGWYHNPNDGKNTPSCRHEWRQNVVILNN
jgi:DNA-binding transcriptional ArsR family regulator